MIFQGCPSPLSPSGSAHDGVFFIAFIIAYVLVGNLVVIMCCSIQINLCLTNYQFDFAQMEYSDQPEHVPSLLIAVSYKPKIVPLPSTFPMQIL